MILYRSIQSLTTLSHADIFSLQAAYLPVEIYAGIRVLTNKTECTKLPAPPAEDFTTYQAMELQ